MNIKKTTQRLAIFCALIFVFAMLAVNATPFNCDENMHDYVRIEYIPPTDVSDGRVVYECRICDNISVQILFATGHIWSEWQTITEPTCTEPGLRTRTCSVGVPHSENEEIPALGHDFIEKIIEPTCATVGQTIRTCLRCGYSYTVTLGELGECNYIETITKEPTCNTHGERTFTCEVCGDYFIEPINMLEHAWGEWVVNTPAEVGVEGQKHKECERCGERVYEAIAALPTIPELLPAPNPPLFGIEEVIATSANIALWITLFLVLSGEFLYLLIRRKKKKAILAKRKFAYSGEDGYKSI